MQLDIRGHHLSELEIDSIERAYPTASVRIVEIDDYRQPKITRTDEDPSTLPGTSQESTESPGQNRNDPQPEQETQNKGNLLLTPNQPSQYNFPKKRYGNQYRSVQSTWFSEYPWLHYDEKKTLFCYICSNQYLNGNLASAKNTEQAFTSNGFLNPMACLL